MQELDKNTDVHIKASVQKLREELGDILHPSTVGFAEVWPLVLSLLLEVEHHVEHVVKCGACDDCSALALATLGTLNHEDFLEIAKKYPDVYNG